jgi:hypothetical protein
MVAALAATFVLSAPPDGVAQTDRAAVVKTYADIGQAMYEDALARARAAEDPAGAGRESRRRDAPGGPRVLAVGPRALHADRGLPVREQRRRRGAACDSTGTLLGVSCPRGGLAVFWDLATSRVIATVDMPDGCGLAPLDAPGAFLLTSGRGGVARVELPAARSTPLLTPFVARARWDNHLAVAPLGEARR